MKRNRVGNAVRRARQNAANVARNRMVGLYAALDKRRGVVAPVVAVAPVVVAPVEHVTSVVERDGKHWPSCACGWDPGKGMTQRGAKGQATRHRNSEQDRAGNGSAMPVRREPVTAVPVRRDLVAA